MIFGNSLILNLNGTILILKTNGKPQNTKPPDALNVTIPYLPVSTVSSRTASAVFGILRSGSLIKIK